MVPRVLFEELLILHDIEINGEYYFKSLFHKLTGYKEINKESLEKLFSFLVGAVVTRSQHPDISKYSGMPSAFYDNKHLNFGNAWLRYIIEGIDIFEVKWEREMIVSYKLL